MPELPEVETTCRGIAPHIEGQSIKHVIVRQPQLRWRIPDSLAIDLIDVQIQTVTRRGKYLLLNSDKGTLIIHLGMSGNLRIMSTSQDAGKHDHVDFTFANNSVLRFNDTRRFGAVLWTTQSSALHPLLKNLGIEPLFTDFNGEYLYKLSRKRSVAVKLFIMNSHIVVGVGNIYANEALFMAGILPTKAAGSIELLAYQRLAECIKTILQQAIERGGTTLRDFVNEAGIPGYFQQQLRVYGRAGQACVHCSQALTEIRLANRSTVFCNSCQC
ncbi:MAG: bifunctional DNA-formamidopyrimidine glycosylase/DNA-(apurinic or apyrimidinic site) lyase [Methylococcaceae bacterium]